MKTVKTLTIIFGIVIGIIGLFTSSLHAEDLKENMKAEKAELVKLQTAIYDAKMQETENILIEDYLQMVSFEHDNATVAIVNHEGKTIFAGEKVNAGDLLKNSEFLFSFGDQEHYMIIE
ncbi:MAG: hypothetical protein ACOCXH_14900 [Cyclobacteriaceae bacterium]